MTEAEVAKVAAEDSPHYWLGRAEALLEGWLDPEMSIKQLENATFNFLAALRARRGDRD